MLQQSDEDQFHLVYVPDDDMTSFGAFKALLAIVPKPAWLGLIVLLIVGIWIFVI